MKVLHIDASVRSQGSTSREMSAFFLDELRANGVELEIDRLDLAETPPNHFGPVQTDAMYLPIEDHTPEMAEALSQSNALVDRVLAADALVIGVPIYNFGAPSAFKAFLDNISRSGRTFAYTETGLVGHLSDKKIVVLESAGGNYREGAMFAGLDCLSPHVKAIFNFLGAQPEIILTHPTMFEGPEMKDTAIGEAKEAARAVAKAWAA